MACKIIHFVRSLHGNMNCRKCEKSIVSLISYPDMKLVARSTNARSQGRSNDPNTVNDKGDKIQKTKYYCLSCARNLKLIW